MTFNDLLLEASSAILFHATSSGNLKKILKDDEFNLTNSLYSSIKGRLFNKKKYPYFISFSRTMQNDFTERALYIRGLVIEFDAQALRNNFKFYSVNWDNPNDEEAYVNSYREEPFEAEDRLVSKKDRIKGIKKYIKAIHALDSCNKVQEIVEIKGDIPLYIYKDIRSLLLRNKKNMVKL